MELMKLLRPTVRVTVLPLVIMSTERPEPAAEVNLSRLNLFRPSSRSRHEWIVSDLSRFLGKFLHWHWHKPILELESVSHSWWHFIPPYSLPGVPEKIPFMRKAPQKRTYFSLTPFTYVFTSNARDYTVWPQMSLSLLWLTIFSIQSCQHRLHSGSPEPPLKRFIMSSKCRISRTGFTLAQVKVNNPR